MTLTDCPDQAAVLQRRGPVIGICSSKARQSWCGILFVAESWEAVDQEYARLAFCRWHGLPRTLIEAEGWRIREADQKDAEGFAGLYADPLTRQFMECPLKDTAEAYKDRVRLWRDWIEGCRRYVYPAEEPALWVLADTADRLLGCIGLEWRQAQADIPEGYYAGYGLLPTARHKKLAAAAASFLVPYCMEYWQLDQIYLLCDSANTASAVTAVRSGFTRVQLLSGEGQALSGPEHILQHTLDDLSGIGPGKLFLFFWK